MAQNDNTNKNAGSIEEQELLTGTSVYVVEQNANMKVGQYATLQIDEKFVLQIKKEKEGYVIDILPINKKYDDAVLDSITVWNDELEAEA